MSLDRAPGSKFEKCQQSIDPISKKRCELQLYAIPFLRASSNILTPLMACWCIVFVGNGFFLDKINLIRKLSESPISPRYTRYFRCQTFFLSNLASFCSRKRYFLWPSSEWLLGQLSDNCRHWNREMLRNWSEKLGAKSPSTIPSSYSVVTIPVLMMLFREFLNWKQLKPSRRPIPAAKRWEKEKKERRKSKKKSKIS